MRFLTMGGMALIFENNRPEPTVRVPGVSTSVAAFQHIVETIHIILVLRPSGLQEPAHYEIPLGVHVGADVMGDLPGGVAQPNTLIKCRPSGAMVTS